MRRNPQQCKYFVNLIFYLLFNYHATDSFSDNITSERLTHFDIVQTGMPGKSLSYCLRHTSYQVKPRGLSMYHPHFEANHKTTAGSIRAIFHCRSTVTLLPFYLPPYCQLEAIEFYGQDRSAQCQQYCWQLPS